METVWTKNIDEILMVGKPLHNIGINNWALTREETLKVLEIFSDKEIPVLGGDVYEYNDNVLKSNYDSWFYNASDASSAGDFVIESILKAKKYVKEYRSDSKKEFFFVLVPKTYNNQ